MKMYSRIVNRLLVCALCLSMLRIAKSITVEETPDLPEYAPVWIPDGFVEMDITQGRHYCSRDY